MSLFHRCGYNSKERLSERIGDLDEKVDKLEAQLQALTVLLGVAYGGGLYSAEAFYIVKKTEK